MSTQAQAANVTITKNKPMVKMLGTPGKYIQGAGAIQRIGEVLHEMGKKPLFLVDVALWSSIKEKVSESLESESLEATFVKFNGECCYSEIKRVAGICREAGSDVIVGIGGGKAIDTAKGVTFHIPLPIVIVPTIASNDAPTSRRVIVYTDTGEPEESITMAFNPQVILVDTGIIAQAPARFLVAGMGDAIATKFEADQSVAKGCPNYFQARPLHTALVIADTCYSVIREHGVAAKQAVEKKMVTESLDLVVEANIYLSGIGFESVGLAAAHALAKSFSGTKEMHGSLHGEEVGVGLLAQLFLERRPDCFMEDMVTFYRAVGLPHNLARLGLVNPTEEKLQAIVQRAFYKGSHIHRMSFPITEEDVLEALKCVNSLP